MIKELTRYVIIDTKLFGSSSPCPVKELPLCMGKGDEWHMYALVLRHGFYTISTSH